MIVNGYFKNIIKSINSSVGISAPLQLFLLRSLYFDLFVEIIDKLSKIPHPCPSFAVTGDLIYNALLLAVDPSSFVHSTVNLLVPAFAVHLVIVKLAFILLSILHDQDSFS